MFKKICVRCGVHFGSVNKKGRVCGPCLRQRTEEFENTPLRDLTSTAVKVQREIKEAKDLLTRMGYDIQGDVHSQFVERAKSRYGVTF